MVIGNDLIVSWREGANFGIDRIDWTTKYPNAYLTTLIIAGTRHRAKDFKNYIISYDNRPVGTDITLETSINQGPFALQTLTDDVANAKTKLQRTLAGGNLQLRIRLTTSGNLSPIVSEIYCDWDEKQTL
ncbi:MAG: hypothetical protein DDT42_02130 [candidate division WS2 bacterium]|uniref:Uncharacterized protein n=1 Tax=Psychracetigena formicireducens TaxID=2986056 RepID=A0A9E2F839_PSYF1|nr:hypothetical protein [Candidatus Psychracetigena formicireducens]